MPGPTEEQINKWRKRWRYRQDLPAMIAKHLMIDNDDMEDNLDLSNEIAKFLMKNKEEMATSGNKIIEVYETIRSLLHDLKNRGFDIPNDQETSIKIGSNDFSVPFLDLRGIEWRNEQLENIVLPGAHLDGASLRSATLNNANLESATLKGVDLTSAIMNGADLSFACLIDANLPSATLHNANLISATLSDAFLFDVRLNGAYLNEAILDDANLMYAKLKGADLSKAKFVGANFKNARVGAIKRISQNTEESTDEKLELEQIDIVTRFSHSEYLPSRKQLPSLRAKYKEEHYPGKKNTFLLKSWIAIRVFIHFIIWGRYVNYWFFTDFSGLNIDDADTSGDREFAHFVRDQQFIAEIEDKNRLFTFFWWLTSNFGRSPWLIAVWAILIILGFACIYALPWQPASWLPEWWSNFFAMNGPVLSTDDNLKFSRYFFISYDIFSNLGMLTAEAQNGWGRILMVLESVLGFATFASLAAYLANKFFRRAG